MRDEVLASYSKKLKAVHKEGRVLKIHHMEETVNQALTAPSTTSSKKRRRRRRKAVKPPIYGSRFLLELDIELNKPKQRVFHTSEYVYLPKGSDNLCHTVNFQWRRNHVIDVYFVIASELHIIILLCDITMGPLTVEVAENLLIRGVSSFQG